MSTSASIEDDGQVSIGLVSLKVRSQDVGRQFQDMASRLRAQIRNTMEYLGRTARSEMAALAPHGGGSLNLPGHIAIAATESETAIRYTIRPRGSRRIYLAAFTLEGGFSGKVNQYIRRPPGERPRQQASLRSRAKWVRLRDKQMVRVMDYQRTQAAQPFIRPVYDHMAEEATAALSNAVDRAEREGS